MIYFYALMILKIETEKCYQRTSKVIEIIPRIGNLISYTFAKKDRLKGLTSNKLTLCNSSRGL